MTDNIRTPMLSLHGDVTVLQTSIVDALCYVLLILGVAGNISGLLIFSSSRRSCRISPIYACLAVSSSVTNLFCVIRYSVILCSTSRDFIGVLVGHQRWACKLYELSFACRVISSWITLYWMCERLTCVSSRLKASLRPCNTSPIKFIAPPALVCVIICCVIGPPVYMFEPMVSRYAVRCLFIRRVYLRHFNSSASNSTIEEMTCDLPTSASARWQRYFRELHLGFNHFTVRCLFSELIPTAVVVVFNGIVIHYLLRTHRRLAKRNLHRAPGGQSYTRSWMNAVLILHSLLFLSSLLSHIVGHITASEAHETWWVILAVLINSSLNFYVYCLSGEAFRNEIARLIERCRRRCCSGRQVHSHQPLGRRGYTLEMQRVQF